MAQTRSARYHGTGSWPPSLDAILREVDRTYKKRGYFTSPKEFRGVCTTADGSYTRGAADDCMRLLKNAGVLVPGDVGGKSRLIIDQMACTRLQSCFEQDEQPAFPSLAELAKRLPVLQRALQRRTPKPKQKPSPPVAAALPVPPTAPAQPKETKMIAAAPAVSTPRASKPLPIPRYAAFLPPGAAREVWLFLYVCVTRLQSFGDRIAVPNDKLPDGIDCSPAEFDEWMEAFADAGIIEHVGESGGDNDAFRFLIHPDEIHTVEIDARPQIKVPRTWCEVADRVRHEIPRESLGAKTLRNAIAAWVEARFPELRGLTASHKLMGYKPDAGRRTDKCWGIFYKDPGRDGYLPCLPGFEPYELVAMDDWTVRRIHRDRDVGAEEETLEEVEPAQAPEPEPVPEPVAAQPSTRDLLERIRQEQARLEEAERLLTALAGREQTRDKLAVELAQLEGQITADRARLCELGIHVP